MSIEVAMVDWSKFDEGLKDYSEKLENHCPHCGRCPYCGRCNTPYPWQTVPPRYWDTHKPGVYTDRMGLFVAID